MSKKKSKANSKEAIFGGELEEIVKEAVSETTEELEQPNELRKTIKMHGYQRTLQDGSPYIMIENVGNKNWLCIKESHLPSMYYQGENVVVFSVEKDTLIK